jgi:hypothetical protein
MVKKVFLILEYLIGCKSSEDLTVKRVVGTFKKTKD